MCLRRICTFSEGLSLESGVLEVNTGPGPSCAPCKRVRSHSPTRPLARVRSHSRERDGEGICLGLCVEGSHTLSEAYLPLEAKGPLAKGSTRNGVCSLESCPAVWWNIVTTARMYISKTRGDVGGFGSNFRTSNLQISHLGDCHIPRYCNILQGYLAHKKPRAPRTLL